MESDVLMLPFLAVATEGAFVESWCRVNSNYSHVPFNLGHSHVVVGETPGLVAEKSY